MNIRTTVFALSAAALLYSAAPAAAQDAHEVRVGTMVNITTCVVPSLDEDDEFVLTNIVDLPAHPPLAGKVMYWVNDWKKIRDFVGKRIQFDALIKDVDRKEIEVKWAKTTGLGDASDGGGALAEIELTGNKVNTSPETIGLSSSQAMDNVKIPATLIRLKMQNTPTVVSGSCDTAMARTAAVSSAALDLEARAETETVSAARVETPAVAAVEVAAAAETRAVAAPEVAEVAVGRPAAVEIDRPAAASAGAMRTALPATATPLPLLLLLGLGSLTSATALRLRRK